MVYINLIFPFPCVQCEGVQKQFLKNRCFEVGPAKRENLCVLFCPAFILFPPLRFARVILKNHPKNGRFGLHKSCFSVFMRATQGGRAIEISPLASLGRNDKAFDLSSRAKPRDLLLSFFQQPSRRGCAAPPSLTQGGQAESPLRAVRLPCARGGGLGRQSPNRRGCCR